MPLSPEILQQILPPKGANFRIRWRSGTEHGSRGDAVDSAAVGGSPVYVAVSRDDRVVIVDATADTVTRRVPMAGAPFWVTVGRR